MYKYRCDKCNQDIYKDSININMRHAACDGFMSIDWSHDGSDDEEKDKDPT